jgi:tRNA (guanine37-N1)-methyltransferase
MVKYPYDILGNIAIVKFPLRLKSAGKRKFAKILLKETNVKTVLEKIGKFKGRLRKMQTKFIAGEKSKEVLYRENDCVFRFNIDKAYFSPRLSNERKEIASKIKKGDVVLVMFAGVAPYSIVIAKNSRAGKVFSNELNREANKYAELNISLNKVKDKVALLPGDIKRIAKNIHERFDVIVMPRPQLKDSFLKEAFALSKKRTRVYYYDFCKDDEITEITEKIRQEARKAGKKIKIMGTRKAGEIAPHKLRVRADFVITG